MTLLREIGGYFEIEGYADNISWSNGVLLNSGRNALRYICSVLDIKTIWVPEYTCPVVWNALEQDNIHYRFYKIDSSFMPIENFSQDEYILYNNYYGICHEKLSILQDKYKNLIVDNCQALFSKSFGLASFYSFRKFFGVPDGGLAVFSENISNIDLDSSYSYRIVSHLLKRVDLGASEGYTFFQKSEEEIASYDVKKISNLTNHLLKNINLQRAKKKRKENFKYLYNNLFQLNEINPVISDADVPMAYPLFTKDAINLRRFLLDKKIYIPKYWDGCLDKEKSEYILPIPMDHRYSTDDMMFICEHIKYYYKYKEIK